MNVVVSAIVDPWVTTLSFVVALAMRIQAAIASSFALLCKYFFISYSLTRVFQEKIVFLF